MKSSRRVDVEEIAACAWKAIKNSASGEENPLPPVELVNRHSKTLDTVQSRSCA